jgi:hypothetical protein
METLLQIFRDSLNGKLEFVGSGQTLESSLKLVRSTATGPAERFVIFNLSAHEITISVRTRRSMKPTQPNPSSTASSLNK